MNKYFIGIDIGSTCAKTVVMNHEKEILHRFLQPTGWSSVDTAKQIQETLMEKGILPEESIVVATAYGRVSVPYAAKCVTEITCHAKGAFYIHKNENIMIYASPQASFLSIKVTKTRLEYLRVLLHLPVTGK